ncbi:hypothetical protein Aduo_019309 [Ancylostoma duodenale]
MYKINGQNVTLSKEQRKAVVLDTGNLAIVGIQAAFWTGNTVVGVTIAARRANAAAQENLTPIPVDINRILIYLGEKFNAQLSNEEKVLCNKFVAEQSILERYIENPDLALDMEEDKDEYALAERNVSNTVGDVEENGEAHVY